jgi:small subunit ribosomal protein S16
MVRIRLMRVGKRKQPSYRVVVADSRSPRDGRIIEAIGHYQPRQEPSVVEIDSERALHWLGRGAQPSDTVRRLLQISGAWYTFTGERPPAGSPAAGTPKPTQAASVRATPAASVDDADTEPGAEATETTDTSEPVDEAETGATPDEPSAESEQREEEA